MTETKFIEMCLNYQEFHQNIKSTGVLSTAVVELADPIEKIVQELLSYVLTDSGCDLFYWFMFDKGFTSGEPNGLKLYNDNVEISCNTPKELYDFLKNNNHFKNIK